MSIADSLLPEFDQEMATTRRLLARVPGERGEWKPHPKAFALGHRAQLVAPPRTSGCDRGGAVPRRRQA